MKKSKISTNNVKIEITVLDRKCLKCPCIEISKVEDNFVCKNIGKCSFAISERLGDSNA